MFGPRNCVPTTPCANGEKPDRALVGHAITRVRSRVLACLCGVMLNTLTPANVVRAESNTAVEIEFFFQKLGSTRTQVVKALGPPATQQVTKTILFLNWRKLTWIADERRFVASFLNDKLIRTKVCSISILDC